ncbi:uncharacterized protein LOC111267917 isoform X2 [Varroa jacobsoni]|uniref:uncharacterized protein LOC111267917 isoform X2 n=1 Tax=Varroa jacobsoni TaxID=62625 RepID=UPI000BF510F2|nr:uncharacterized protein LOC111267917 isoform X2 [Varroa jacobsoni]
MYRRIVRTFFLHAALQMLSEKKTEVPPVMMMMMPPPMEPVMFPLPDRPMKAPCKILDAVDFDDFILHHHHDVHVDVITDNSMMKNTNEGVNNMNAMAMMEMMPTMKPPIMPAEPPNPLPEGESNRPEMEDIPADIDMSADADQKPTSGGALEDDSEPVTPPMPPPTRYELTSGRRPAPLRLKGGHRRVTRTRSMESVNTKYRMNA